MSTLKPADKRAHEIDPRKFFNLLFWPIKYCNTLYLELKIQVSSEGSPQ
jgi:hypothetical protein